QSPAKKAVGDSIGVGKIKSLGEGCTTEGKGTLRQGGSPTSKDKKRKGREIMKPWVNISISFPAISLENVSEEPLIVEAEVEGYLVRRVYVDEGSSVEVMFEHCFENIDPRIKAKLKETQTDLVGFAGEISKPLEKIELEAYVDDMVIKSKDEKMLLADIAETFDYLKRINMKLNPKKCSFGVEEGKFLGYMVTSEGIRANPKKTKALANLQSPRTLKEMQSLSGKLAALNRFLAKSAERSLPFFNTLKNITKENKHEYRWTKEAEEAFKQMKKLIMDLPSLTPPWTLNEAERNYAPMEKLALSLIHMTRRLRRYFEAHPVLADFLSEAPEGEKEERYFRMPEVPLEKDDTESWTLFIDVASSTKGSGACLVIIRPSGIEYTYAFHLTFPKGIWPKDKNEARCLRAKIAQYAMESGVLFKKGYLVPMLRYVGPLQANYVIREIYMGSCGIYVGPRVVVRKAVRQGYYWPTMHEDAKKEVEKYDSRQIQVPVPKLPKTLMTSIMAPWPFYQWGMDIIGPLPPARGGAKKGEKQLPLGKQDTKRRWSNTTTRRFVRQALGREKLCSEGMKQVGLKTRASWDQNERDHTGSWKHLKMAPTSYRLWKTRWFLELVTPSTSTNVICRSYFKKFQELYEPRLLKADVLSKLASMAFNQLIKEVLVDVLNERSTKSQEDKNEARGLRAKIGQYGMESGVLFKKGYLVPMLRCVGPLKANYVIREIHMGSCDMHVGPRAVVRKAVGNGPLPPARGGAKFVIMEIDYFTKWIKAKPLVKITGNEAHQTSIKQSNEETPCSLTFGSEAVISAEIGIPTDRTFMIREGYNEEEMRLNLDLLQERRETTAIREARYKTKMEQYYNKKVCSLGFRPGESVFQINEASRVEDQGKLGPK
nr:hypothetical protein [Tanacetum cinerariifolium]